MTFLVKVNIKENTLVQDAMKVFNQLENCTVLDVDEKIHNFLKLLLPYPQPHGVTVMMPILPHISNLIEVDVDTIDRVLKSHDCVDQNKTEIELRNPDVPKKIIKIDEWKLSKKLNSMKHDNGTTMWRQAH